MMRRLYGLFMLFLFALMGMGCSPRVVKEYVEVPVEVKVPVAIKCKITMPEEPKIDIGKLDKIPKDVETMGVLIIQEHEEYRRYAGELRAVIRKCSDPP